MRINIWEEGEYNYAASYGFKPNLRTYIHEDDEERACMLVIPGGGYCMVVPHEAQNIALEFYNRGMNAFVLTYTTDITMSVPLRTQPLADVSRAIRIIRRRAAEFKIDPNKIVVSGFSAGGHLCASICTHFGEMVDPNPALQAISDRPNAAILGYPVITAGQYTHKESIASLVGWNATEEERDYFSLEKQVKPDTPPCFLWGTAQDGLVPVENSIMFMQALRARKIPHALYVFPYGDHGLSLANHDFFTGKNVDLFTFEQLDLMIENLKKGTLVNVSAERTEQLKQQFAAQLAEDKKDEQPAENTNADSVEEPKEILDPFPDVRQWPMLAECWLKKLFA